MRAGRTYGEIPAFLRTSGGPGKLCAWFPRERGRPCVVLRLRPPVPRARDPPGSPSPAQPCLEPERLEAWTGPCLLCRIYRIVSRNSHSPQPCLDHGNNIGKKMEESHSYSIFHCTAVWNKGISFIHSTQKANKPLLLEEIENEVWAQGTNEAYVQWFYFIKVLQIYKYTTWKVSTVVV